MDRRWHDFGICDGQYPLQPSQEPWVGSMPMVDPEIVEVEGRATPIGVACYTIWGRNPPQ